MYPYPTKFIPAKGAPPKSPRERALSNWCGFDVPDVEKSRGSHAKGMAQIIPVVAKSLRLDQRQAEAEVVRVWNNLLDPQVTTHAQPTGLRNATLFVTVDSSVWLSEIVRYRRREILERLQHSFGKSVIQRISFRVG